MSKFIPRPYQEEIERQIDACLDNLVRAMLVVSSTGSGKSGLTAYLLDKFARQGKRCLFAVHRRTLVQDIVGRVTAHTDLPISVILPGEQYDASSLIHIGSIQSVMRKAASSLTWPSLSHWAVR